MMGGCCWSLVSLDFFSGTSVYSPSAGFNVLLQIFIYPIHSNPAPFGLLGGRGALTPLDSVMRVIDVFMPVIDVCHACP